MHLTGPVIFYNDQEDWGIVKAQGHPNYHFNRSRHLPVSVRVGNLEVVLYPYTDIRPRLGDQLVFNPKLYDRNVNPQYWVECWIFKREARLTTKRVGALFKELMETTTESKPKKRTRRAGRRTSV